MTSSILVTRPTNSSWWTPECSDAVSAKQLAWKQMSRSRSPQHLVNARQATRACATRLQRAQALHTAQLRQRLARGNMTNKPQSSELGGCSVTPTFQLLQVLIAKSMSVTTTKPAASPSTQPLNAALVRITSRRTTPQLPGKVRRNPSVLFTSDLPL